MLNRCYVIYEYVLNIHLCLFQYCVVHVCVLQCAAPGNTNIFNVAHQRLRVNFYSYLGQPWKINPVNRLASVLCAVLNSLFVRVNSNYTCVRLVSNLVLLQYFRNILTGLNEVHHICSLVRAQRYWHICNHFIPENVPQLNDLAFEYCKSVLGYDQGMFCWSYSALTYLTIWHLALCQCGVSLGSYCYGHYRDTLPFLSSHCIIKNETNLQIFWLLLASQNIYLPLYQPK